MSTRSPYPELDYEQARWTTDADSRPVLVIPVEHLRPGGEAHLDANLSDWLAAADGIPVPLRGACAAGEISVWQDSAVGERSGLADVDPRALRKALSNAVGWALGMEDAVADVEQMDRFTRELREWTSLHSLFRVIGVTKPRSVAPQPTGAVSVPSLPSSRSRVGRD